MKNKWVTVLLAFFLGAMGIEWFYLGNNKRGIITLLLSFIGIGIILGFIDFITFLIMDEKTFNDKYNTGQENSFVHTQIRQTNIADELERLHSLKEKGIISETEFQQRKNKIL